MEDVLDAGRAEVGNGSADSPGAADVADEEAARLAREQYRDVGIPPVDPDPDVAAHLGDGERVLGARTEAALARVDGTTEAAASKAGPLYVTDRRLLQLGTEITAIPLADILELAMAEDHILITLAGARGVVLDVPDPRQFRVLIAAAKSASRG